MKTIFKTSVAATLLGSLIALASGFQGDLAILARDMFLWFFGMGVSADLLSDVYMTYKWPEWKEDLKFVATLKKTGGVPSSMIQKKALRRLADKGLIYVNEKDLVIPC